MDPDEDTLGRMQQLKLEEQEKKELLQTLKGRENITIDGKKIMLYANIGNSKDLAAVLQNDAGGIGLFRSEFIYLGERYVPYRRGAVSDLSYGSGDYGRQTRDHSYTGYRCG